MLPMLIPIYILVPHLPRAIAPSKPPLLYLNFPDPCVIQDPASGTWYAFASGYWVDNGTNSSSQTWINIQVAFASPPSVPSSSLTPATWQWTYLATLDPLPFAGPWAAPGSNSQTWAPSVTQLNATTYLLYYAAQLAGNNYSRFHCIGAATSPNILGPYIPLPQPVICPVQNGGAIDPASFRDPLTGRRYLLYKVDGNSLGRGGECNNGVEPFQRTPIILQEVNSTDGVSVIGDGIEVLDRDGETDGPLVEAPDLMYLETGFGEDGTEGGYVLFYSNHCWDGPGYSVNYAVATGNITGPYKKGATPLIRTGDGFNVTAPGGAASASGGGWMLFHGDCEAGRCLFGAGLRVDGGGLAVS
jgi:hypothetical protein